MIVNIGIGICIFLAIIGWKIERFILNPLTIFAGIWTIVLICSATNPKLTTPHDVIYLYILLGIMIFGVGYFIARHTKKIAFRIGNRWLYNNGDNYLPRFTVLYVIGTICIFAYTYNLYLVVSGAGSLNMAIMKVFLQTFTLQKSSWLNAFYFLLVEPMSTVIPVIAISNMIFGRRDKKLLTIAIVLLVIKTIANTTRNTIIVVIVYFTIGLLISIRERGKRETIKKIIKKRKKQVILAILIGVFVFIAMTVARGVSVFENIWVDFALPPRMFEVWKEEIDSNNIYGYGFASLHGFIYPIFYVLKNILGIQMPSNIEAINDLITRTDTVFVWPGERVTANAYVTAYWFMYLDSRLIGIILGSLILGFISSKMFKQVMKNTNEKNFTMFCFIINAVIFSLARVQFTGVSFALGFIYLFFLYRNNRGVIDENSTYK